jgi:acetolactate synthase-1/2/3 large subunit
VAAVARLVAGSQRLVILAGHGVLAAGAQPELLALAERWGAPVATTLLGIGAIPEDHALSLGMMGMHGGVHTNAAIARADVVLAVGMRFDDRVTGRLDSYLRDAAVIHVDLDAAEIGKNVHPDVAIAADARLTLRALLDVTAPSTTDTSAVEHERHDRKRLLDHLAEGPFVAPLVLDLLDAIAADDAVIVTDVGQHQMWEAQHVTHKAGRTLLTSGGAGAMGYALAAAIGAKIAQPHREVWAVMGDGGFQMASPELATLAQEGLAVRCVVLNNGYLGMVRQWQELFFEKRYSHTQLSGPDFVALAAAHGVAGMRADDVASAGAALSEASTRPGPVLVDCRILADDNVYPMIAPGRAIDEMITREPAAP